MSYKKLPHEKTLIRKSGKIRFIQTKKTIIVPRSISDEDWSNISKTTVLPEDARVRVSAAMGTYDAWVASTKTTLQSKRLVEALKKGVRRVKVNAEKLKSDGVFFNAGQAAAFGWSGPTPADIDGFIEDFAEFDQLLEDAQQRMQMARGRKPDDALASLITHLAWIQADSKRIRLKRSSKIGSLRATNAFVEACVRVADPKILKSKIEAVLAKNISKNRKIVKEEGFDTFTGEIVHESGSKS